MAFPPCCTCSHGEGAGGQGNTLFLLSGEMAPRLDSPPDKMDGRVASGQGVVLACGAARAASILPADAVLPHT
jgi:hypothetical protein